MLMLIQGLGIQDENSFTHNWQIDWIFGPRSTSSRPISSKFIATRFAFSFFFNIQSYNNYFLKYSFI